MSCCDPATSMWHNVWLFLIAAILFFHAHFVNARLADIERAIREACIEVEQASEEPSDPAVRKCSGCGAEWKNLGPGPYKPITNCPECPLSMDEFQALQKAARERAAK